MKICDYRSEKHSEDVPSMTKCVSAARLAANRRNAQKSTGPRSAAGKARSSQNALKHGLGVPVERDVGVAAQLRNTSDLLGLGCVTPVGREAAHQVAEAHVEMQRIQEFKKTVLDSAARRITGPTKKMPSEHLHLLAFAAAADELAGLMRYERRARSRQRRFLLILDGEQMHKTEVAAEGINRML